LFAIAWIAVAMAAFAVVVRRTCAFLQAAHEHCRTLKSTLKCTQCGVCSWDAQDTGCSNGRSAGIGVAAASASAAPWFSSWPRFVMRMHANDAASMVSCAWYDSLQHARLLFFSV